MLLAQTDRWMIVNKPAGWLTIPGRTAPGAVPLPVVQSRVEVEVGQKLWVVHRLDVETSGVLLFAKTPEAHREACQWFEKHRVKKTYEFLAEGALPMPVCRVSSPVKGLASLTQVESKESFQGAFLGRAYPQTGRRHQIRVHLAAQGCPLLGDPTYGGKKEWAGVSVPRVALHAARLELPTGEKFEAQWPEDFQSWVEAFRCQERKSVL